MTDLNSLFDAQAARGNPVTDEAAALLTIWRRLETSHLPISFGCSCGALGHVRAQDFEQDVLSYLFEKHTHAAAEIALLEHYIGPENNRHGGIAALLKGLADGDSPAEARRRLLSDLQRSIMSWANAGLAASRPT